MHPSPVQAEHTTPALDAGKAPTPEFGGSLGPESIARSSAICASMRVLCASLRVALEVRAEVGIRLNMWSRVASRRSWGSIVSKKGETYKACQVNTRRGKVL
jgi:hypothetical protein